jgi:hypothetical protein
MFSLQGDPPELIKRQHLLPTYKLVRVLTLAAALGHQKIRVFKKNLTA